MKYDVLAYLESTKPKPSESPNQSKNLTNEGSKIHKRRSSVAGGQLFSIENKIVESASDFYEPILRFGAANQFAVATNDVESVESTKSIEENVGKNSESNANGAIIPMQFGEVDVATINVESAESIEKDVEKNSEINVNGAIIPIQFAEFDVATNGAESTESMENNGEENIESRALVESVQSGDISDIQLRHNYCSVDKSGGPATPMNNFDPFRRLPNVPFAMCGRKRRNSMLELYRPSLCMISEVPENVEKP